MTRWTASLPRWILALEMAVCLVPLTLLFAAVVAAATHGAMALPRALAYCIGSLVGPAGLAVALKAMLSPVRPIGRMTTALLGALALWTLIAYAGEVLHNGAWLNSWREFILIAVLPALAVCHLMRIDYERRALTVIG